MNSNGRVPLRVWRSVLVVALLGCLAPRVQSSEATLEWDANAEPDVVGYNAYVGTQSRQYETTIDVSAQPQKRVQSLEPGRTYYFAVTAYNSGRLESEFSEEVSYTVPISGTNLFLMPLSITRVEGFPAIDFPVQPGRI